MLNKKERKRILKILKENLGCEIEGNIEIAEYEDKKILIIDGKVRGFITNDMPFLNVVGLKEYGASKKYVVVDDGAIKHILNGADIMAPGIIDADDDIKKGDTVWVRDERGTPIAVGLALINGEEMKKMMKGKAIRNIHHTGDKLWKISV